MTDHELMYRHPSDPNLLIFTGRYYNGIPLIWQRGPYIYNYLERIEQTIKGAFQDHANIMAVRVDLRLPFQFFPEQPQRNRPLFSRFIDSLNAKIKSRQAEIERNGKRFHPTKLHYIWTREFGQNGNPHYHCVLLINKQTFRGLGEFNPNSRSLYGMISSAWASALRMEKSLADGLVSIPRNDAIYQIRKDELQDDLFRRVSYFAKLPTKQFGLGSHNFGTSRTTKH